jgi:hypothetical protein
VTIRTPASPAETSDPAAKEDIDIDLYFFARDRVYRTIFTQKKCRHAKAGTYSVGDKPSCVLRLGEAVLNTVCGAQNVRETRND